METYSTINKQYVVEHITNFILNDTRYNIKTKFSKERNHSKVFNLQMVENPYESFVVPSSNDVVINDPNIILHEKLLKENPVLNTTFVAIQRLSFTDDFETRMKNIFDNFMHSYEQVHGTDLDAQAYAYAAMIYYIAILQAWFEIHPNIKEYGNKLAWCMHSLNANADLLVESLLSMYGQHCDQASFIEELFDQILCFSRIYGSFGIGMKEVLDENPTTDIPY